MKSDSKYALAFMFEADHTLTDVNGKTFTYGSQQTVFYYRQMVVLLNDTNGKFGELEIWFFREVSNFREGGSSNVKLTAYGDFSGLLSYLDNLAKEY